MSRALRKGVLRGKKRVKRCRHSHRLAVRVPEDMLARPDRAGSGPVSAALGSPAEGDGTQREEGGGRRETRSQFPSSL